MAGALRILYLCGYNNYTDCVHTYINLCYSVFISLHLCGYLKYVDLDIYSEINLINIYSYIKVQCVNGVKVGL